MVDVKGKDAVEVTIKDTGQKTIIIPVHFTGAGMTGTKVGAIVVRANTLNLDGSSVKIVVVPTDKKIDGKLNTMDFSPGKDKKFGPAGEGAELGGKKAHIDSSSATGTDAAAHDILHFAGIKGQYVEGPPDANGNEHAHGRL